MGIVIFGTGDILHHFRKQINFSRVIYLADNNIKKQGTFLYQKEIIAPDQLLKVTFSQIIIFSTKYFPDMYQQLVRLGIPEDKIKSWYIFIGEMQNTMHLNPKISSWAIPKALGELIQRKALHTLLVMGASLDAYSILNLQDDRFKDLKSDVSFDRYSINSSNPVGVSCNLYKHCYTQKGEICSQNYDAVVFLDAFLYCDIEQCKRKILDTFTISPYVILNIPYGEFYRDWKVSIFLQFGQVEVFSYFFGQFLVIKKQQFVHDFCKIFVVTHKQCMQLSNKLYIRIQAGAEGHQNFGYVRDNIGDNISVINPWINECTALYWLWKNVDCQYIGLNHYRRYFLKDNAKPSLQNILDEETIRSDMSLYDVLVAKAVVSYPDYRIGEAMQLHVSKDAYIKGMSIVRGLLAQRQPMYLKTFDALMDGWTFYPCNMFVMKKLVMDQYCEWLFSFLIDAVKAIDISSYDSYSQRIIGFLAERMLTVWLMHHQLRIKECSVLLIE